jgi:hypothetical protein
MLTWAQSFFVALVLFIVYAEFSPGMGGILIRPGPDGGRVITLTGLLHFLGSPLWYSGFWTTDLIDLNALIVVPTITLLLKLLSKLFG